MRESLSDHTILLVEGRKAAAERLISLFVDQGCSVITASTRRDAWAGALEARPAVIVLDSVSVRFDSKRFCRALRDAHVEIPVLMLLPKDERADRRVGARATLHYPFSSKKLLNRVSRLLPTPRDDLLTLGDVVLNLRQCSVARGRRETTLTPKQAALLEIFLRHPGEVLSRAFLMKQIWDTDYLGDTRTLDVHIHWVRKAIELDARSPELLRTVRRRGYVFQLSKAEKSST